LIVARTIAEVRTALVPSRQHRIGFVATMGALHEGHRSLVRAATKAADVVVMSIFVNPLQFGPPEDFASYPKDTAADLELAEKDGVAVVFCPSVEEMYPEDSSTTVSVGRLGEILEGRSRPGHFTGVATVVVKLFNIVQPDIGFFGEKDAQQVAVVRRMVTDLSLDVQILTCPTVRTPDGLALSSRNRYLSPDERQRATALYRSLEIGEETLHSTHDAEIAEKQMWSVLTAEEGVVPDYAAAVDPASFGPPRPGASILLAVAARIGTTRLIDNMLVSLSP
jgi:pantoate--beta-alanine ligase